MAVIDLMPNFIASIPSRNPWVVFGVLNYISYFAPIVSPYKKLKILA
jgi:hypothetical protein